MTDSNMKVKCNLLTGGLPVRWRLRRKKYGHCFHFHPHPASPRPWHREPLQDRLILLSFMKQLWPVENLNQPSAAKYILAVLLSARISGDTGGRLHECLWHWLGVWVMAVQPQRAKGQQVPTTCFTDSSNRHCVKQRCSHRAKHKSWTGHEQTKGN